MNDKELPEGCFQPDMNRMEELESELALLKEQMSGKTQFCVLCESTARERDALRAKLDVCIIGQQVLKDSCSELVKALDKIANRKVGNEIKRQSYGFGTLCGFYEKHAEEALAKYKNTEGKK